MPCSNSSATPLFYGTFLCWPPVGDEMEAGEIVVPVHWQRGVMWLLEKSVLIKKTAGKLYVFPSLFPLQEVDKCLADGADEFLQLMSLCALVMQQLTQNI